MVVLVWEGGKGGGGGGCAGCFAGTGTSTAGGTITGCGGFFRWQPLENAAAESATTTIRC